MGLFSDIYNTVARFFRPQEEQEEGASKAVAANRLKLVLMQDRTNLTPKILEQMRGELIDLLSKYLEMDKELLELNFEQEGDQVALMLSIPVIRAKDEDEIEEALKASADEKTEPDEDSEEDSEEIVDEEESEDSETAEEAETETNSETEEPVKDSSEEEAPKPKRKRSKKVSHPEEMESHQQEESSQEVVFENTES